MYPCTPLPATHSGLKQSKAKEAGGQASSNTMQTGRVWGGRGGLMTVRSGPGLWPWGQTLYPLFANDDFGFRLYRKLDTVVR